MVKISKYSKYGEYAKTIEILSRLTKNKFKITPVDANYFDVDEFDADEIDADEFDEKFNEPKPKGITTNTTGMLMFFGFNRWEIKFVKGYEKVIPHEMCYVIADEIADLIADGLVEESSKLTELSETNNLSL